MNKNNTISCSPWFLLIPQTCAIKYYRNKVHGLLFIPHICIQEKRHSTYEFLPQKSPLSLAMHTPLSMPPSYVQDSCLQGNRRDNYIHDARNKWQQMNQPKQNNTHHSSIPHAYANSIHQSTTDKESKTRLSWLVLPPRVPLYTHFSPLPSLSTGSLHPLFRRFLLPLPKALKHTYKV